MKIAAQMDNIFHINPQKDSTFAILFEAQNQGHEIFYFLPNDLHLETNQKSNSVKLTALVRKMKLQKTQKDFCEIIEEKEQDLTDLDVILIRQDPPFNMEYISSTYLLEKIQNQVLILNNPAEIRNCSEKIFVTDFANLTPKTIFTKSIDKIEKFREKHSKIILKPLYACGGEGISLIDKNTKNLPEIFKELQENFEGPIIAQEFLPEIKDGDKRILLLNGEPIGIIARIPAKNEIRANFHAGGSAKKVELSKKELEICKKIGPELKKRGLFFVGIDVIGDFITEINVTSPTGINEINQANNCRIEEKIVEEIEKEFLKFKKLT